MKQRDMARISKRKKRLQQQQKKQKEWHDLLNILLSFRRVSDSDKPFEKGSSRPQKKKVHFL